MSDLTIVFTTWPNHPKRWQYFSTCIPRVLLGVTASRHEISYKCISENQHDPLHNWYGDHLEDFCRQHDIPLKYRTRQPSLGGMMNEAMRESESEFTMIVQDDWFLEKPFDISEGIDVMKRNPEVDIVRYSYPNVDVECEFDGWKKIQAKGMWPYGDDPHIRRKTFTDKFGPYIEFGEHGISEGDMVYKFMNLNAFVLISDERHFGHCGEVSAVINEKRERAIKR